MDKESILKSYRRYARHYDNIFGQIFDPGRRMVVERMDCQPGEHILEVGVGTGISLTYYPRQAKVCGIDLSPHMLERAEQRVESYELDNVTLYEMDAEHMEFPNDHFDRVAAMYVVSVVENPKDLVAEIKRVCKPGGDLFILNHFTHKNGLISSIEKMLSPLAKLLGFRPNFPLEDFISSGNLNVLETMPVNMAGYWTLIHAKND